MDQVHHRPLTNNKPFIFQSVDHTTSQRDLAGRCYSAKGAPCFATSRVIPPLATGSYGEPVAEDPGEDPNSSVPTAWDVQGPGQDPNAM